MPSREIEDIYMRARNMALLTKRPVEDVHIELLQEEVARSATPLTDEDVERVAVAIEDAGHRYQVLRDGDDGGILRYRLVDYLDDRVLLRGSITKCNDARNDLLARAAIEALRGK